MANMTICCNGTIIMIILSVGGTKVQPGHVRSSWPAHMENAWRTSRCAVSSSISFHYVYIPVHVHLRYQSKQTKDNITMMPTDGLLVGHTHLHKLFEAIQSRPTQPFQKALHFLTWYWLSMDLLFLPLRQNFFYPGLCSKLICNRAAAQLDNIMMWPHNLFVSRK